MRAMKTVLFALAYAATAHADPQIDVFDANGAFVRSINLGSPFGTFVRDMEVDSNGDLYVAINDTGWRPNTCDPDDMIKRFSNTGTLLATYKSGLAKFDGVAIHPTGGAWATAQVDCSSSSQMRLYQFDATGLVVEQSDVRSSLLDVDYYPDGTLAAVQDTLYLRYDPQNLSVLNTVSLSPRRAAWPIYDFNTGNIMFTESNGGTSNTIELNTAGGIVSVVPTYTYADQFSRIQYVRTDGRWAMSTSPDSLTQNPAFTVSYDIVNPQRTGIEETETYALSRESASRVITDTNGFRYIATSGARPIDDLDVSLSNPTPGATTSLTYSFTTPSDLPNTAELTLELGFGLDMSAVDDLDIAFLDGIDGAASFSYRDAIDYYGDLIPMAVVVERQSGSTVPQGTLITVQIDNIATPAEEGEVTVEGFRLVDVRTTGSQVGKARGQLDALSIGGSGGSNLVCTIGTPQDWSGDGEDDVCIDSSSTVDPGADLGPGVQVGPGAVVEAGAQVGAGTIVRSGSYVSTRAVVGEDNDLGPGTIVGRRATLGDDVTTAGDVVIGRSATLGSNIDLPAFSSIGYAAQIGDNASFTNALVLGSLARIGGPAASNPAVSCVGPLTVARGSQIAASPDHTLTCLGSAVIGPDSVLGSGAVLGDNTRLRKDVNVADFLTTGSNVRIERSAQLASNVTIERDVQIGTRAQVCGDTTVSQSLGRSQTAPGCP